MNLKQIFLFAYKNLWRNKRRTSLNVLGLMLTVALVIYFLAFYRGTYHEMMFENYIRYKSAHFQIHNKGIDEIDEMLNKKMMIKNIKEIERQIRLTEGIKEFSPRLKTFGFISNGKEKFPVTVIGIIPEKEKKVLILGNLIVEGDFLKHNDGKINTESKEPIEKIVIGKKLADIMGLKLDDTAYIYTNTVDSFPNLAILKVGGLIHTNFSEFDKNTVFMHIKKLGELIDMEDSINEVLISANSTRQVDNIEKILLKNLKRQNLQINSWKHYAKAFIKGAKGDAAFYYIFIIILILISVSTISTTLSVSIFERTKEFGTLRALGYYKNDIKRLFMTESFIIGTFGSLLGAILGFTLVTLNYYFTYKYELGSVFNMPPMEIKTSPSFYDFIFGIILGIVTSIIAGYFPSKRASKMNIIDAIQVIR